MKLDDLISEDRIRELIRQWELDPERLITQQFRTAAREAAVAAIERAAKAAESVLPGYSSRHWTASEGFGIGTRDAATAIRALKVED